MCNDTAGAPGWRGCQDLDTCSFAIQLAAHLLSPSSSPNRTRAAAQYRAWAPALLRSLEATATAPDGSGLLWSNTSAPVIGYGFQDAEIKSGAVLYSSVLAWNASRLLAGLAEGLGADAALAAALRSRADGIRAAATAQLWDGAQGVFRASTGIGAGNIDVWGNALAGAAGFASAAQAAAILDFFQAHEADLFYEGQVREIPAWQQWEQARYVSGTPAQHAAWDGETPQAKATARGAYLWARCVRAAAAAACLPVCLSACLPACLPAWLAQSLARSPPGAVDD